MIDMARKKEQIIRLSQPIDLRYKCVRTFWGKRKIVTTSMSEQRKFKKNILKFFPDNMFYDDWDYHCTYDIVEFEESGIRRSAMTGTILTSETYS